MSEGWVKIYRSLMDNPIWTEEPFTKGQAWVDLIMMANHEDKQIFTKHGNVVTVKRGSLLTSTQNLADRWQWSRGRVMRHLNVLKKLKMVTAVGTADGTLVTLVKYDDFQGGRSADGTALGTEDGTAGGTALGTRTRREEIKEGKNARAARPHHKTLAEKLAAIEERRQRLEREEQEAAEREKEKKDD